MDFDGKLAAECARAFSLTTGLGCRITSANGEELNRCGMSAAECRLCKCLGEDSHRCTSAQLYGMHEAERYGGKYIYFCDMGLTLFTSPILGSAGTVAQMTVGPFLMVDESDFITNDLTATRTLDEATLAEATAIVSEIPRIEANRVNAMSELLFLAVGFLNNVSAQNRQAELYHSTAQQAQISSFIHALKQGKPQPYPFRTERELVQAVRRGSEDEADTRLNELLGNIFFSFGGDDILIKSRIGEILTLLSRTVIESGVNASSVFAVTAPCSRLLYTESNLDAVCIKLKSTLHALIRLMIEDTGGRHSDTIHRAMQYVQIHFAERLSLNSVAHAVSVSPSYLSRSFKQETGMSFTRYVNRVRIERAKGLLKRGELTLSEIAQLTGFEDQSYFTKVFRKECGVTPLKFKKGL